MKPRYKPGKIATEGKAARAAMSNSKMLTPSQMERLQKAKALTKTRAGKGGKRASWDIDYEQGIQVAKKKMPDSDNQAWTSDGVRKFPKNGR